MSTTEQTTDVCIIALGYSTLLNILYRVYSETGRHILSLDLRNGIYDSLILFSTGAESCSDPEVLSQPAGIA